MLLITLQGFCKALRVEKVSDEGCMRDSLAVFIDSHARCGAKCFHDSDKAENILRCRSELQGLMQHFADFP